MTPGLRRSLGHLAFALALLAAGAALAQEATDAGQRRQRLEAFNPNSGSVSDPTREEDMAFPEAPDPSARSPATAEAYQASLQAYYDYRLRGYEHRLQVFEWQLWSTKVIFYVVLLLVLAGIYFAAIQFHVGLRRRGDALPAPAAETEVSLSLSAIKVRSPVLGVIILTMSLAFFYLYLVHVYPIRNVF